MPTSPIRVMIVDDSAVVRGMLHRSLQDDPEIELVPSASTGLMALQQLERAPVDVVVLDIEMPEMDGLTALPKILQLLPDTRVIIASSLTEKNVNLALKALALGAADCISKPSARNDQDALSNFYRELAMKVKALGRGVKPRSVSLMPAPVPAPATAPTKPVVKPAAKPLIKAVAVAASTGGPQALIGLMEGLRDKMPHTPIFITQHMPPMFTKILADHLSRASGKHCVEAQEGEAVQPGYVYIAPGDFHMTVEVGTGSPRIKLNQNPPENYCRPAADPMLRSLAQVYSRNLLVAVLTGMGQDGLEGARVAAKAGASIVAQDEASSVVWGMPRAVAEAGLAQAVLPLSQIAHYLVKTVEEGGRS